LLSANIGVGAPDIDRDAEEKDAQSGDEEMEEAT